MISSHFQGRRWGWGWIAFTALLAVSACAPELGNSRPPDVMEFDPTADPPRSPEPNAVVINPETGRIDFGVLGTPLPAYADECVNWGALPVAQCEFYMYLQTLDGFPSVSPVRAPVSAELNLDTLTQPENLFVLDVEAQAVLSGLGLSWRSASRYLVIESYDGWQLGHTYVMAVRGYDNGVQAADGNRVVSSATYFMLRQQESLLTCQPDAAGIVPVAEQVLDPHCKWYELTIMQVGSPEAAAASLVSLETLRQAFLGADLWNILSQVAYMEREETAIVWSFPIHTASVVELNPPTGTVPLVVDSDTLRLAVKGRIDPDTLVPYDILGPSNPADKGTVFLLNLTALSQGDMFGGFVEHTVDYANDAIFLNTTAPMVDGNLYGIILTVPAPEDDAPRNGITNPDGVPIVPSPVTVLLRSRGAIVDATGASLVSGITAEQGAELEAGRQQLLELLENPQFVNAASIQRENIAYLYGFEYPNP